ncbi:MAG: ATPase domain-containing protein [Nitrososphaeraceae archaeon]
MTIERISTGIPALDALIEGGIPKGFTVLVAGNPGTGKTILTTQFLYDGLLKGEAALYVSCSESTNQFYENFDRFGMRFSDFERDNKFAYLDFASITKEGVTDALEEVLNVSRNIGAKRLVIDSFSAILLAFNNINEARIALHVVLGKMLRSEGITNMLITEVPIGSNSIGSGMEEFVADGIIQLQHGNTNAIPSTLKVIKMRSTSINRETHVSFIGEKGMVVYPKQPIQMIFPTSRDRIKTGVPGLDLRVEGGFFKGTATILAGVAGSGKTTFGFQFAAQGVLDGQISIFCSLEESPGEIRTMAESLGIDVDDLEKKGLHILSWIPENQSPDAFISALASRIDALRSSILVLDGLSTFKHLHSPDMYSIAKRLVNLIESNDITSIFTFLTDQEPGPILPSQGIFSIFQNIILLRYVEADAQLKRSMSILKMRASNHDQSILQFAIQSKIGLKIIDEMSEYHGILSGNAQKGYQRYMEKEKEIQEKEIRDRKKRKAKVDSHHKKLSEQVERKTLRRAQNRI